MSDDLLFERWLRLIARLLDRAVITSDEAAELQLEAFRTVRS